MNLIEGLEAEMGVKIPEDLTSDETNKFLQALTVKYNVNCQTHTGTRSDSVSNAPFVSLH